MLRWAKGLNVFLGCDRTDFDPLDILFFVAIQQLLLVEVGQVDVLALKTCQVNVQIHYTALESLYDWLFVAVRVSIVVKARCNHLRLDLLR